MPTSTPDERLARDTMCAIVGGFVASYTGAAGIPAEWLKRPGPLPEWAFHDQTFAGRELFTAEDAKSAKKKIGKEREGTLSFFFFNPLSASFAGPRLIIRLSAVK